MNIKFDSEPVYSDNDKYIKTKIKIYGDKVNIDFQGKKVPKENASCDSFIKANKNYYTQTLSKKCKYESKTTKIENFINDELEPRLSDDETDSETESDNDFGNESDNE